MLNPLRLAAFFLALCGILSTSLATGEGVAVYHSPDDSGTNVGPVSLGSSGTTTLHLYMDGGAMVSTGPEPCCAGEGDEILGWNFHLSASGGIAIDSIAPVGDVIVDQAPTLLSMNGGNFQSGDLGPTKLADIEVESNGDGVVALIFGQVVRPTLTLEDVDLMTIIGVPEPSFGILLSTGILGLIGLVMPGRVERRS
jgi:hypothetical protein